MSSFSAKALRVTLTLNGPLRVFPGTTSNTLTLNPTYSTDPSQNMWITADIRAIACRATAIDLKIFGMLPADMNGLTTVFPFVGSSAVLDQTVTVEASSGIGWTQVFSGTINEAQPEYSQAPSVYFHIQAITGYFAKVTPGEPLAYTGATSVVQIVQTLANAMNLTLINSGVTAILQNPYYPGTLFDQLRSVCEDSRTDFYIESQTLVITPHGVPKANVQAVILTPQSGLIGYPTFGRMGITVMCLFNPAITGGGNIQIQGSDIPASNGTWMPFAMQHILSTEQGGRWDSTVQCIPYPS